MGQMVVPNQGRNSAPSSAAPAAAAIQAPTVGYPPVRSSHAENGSPVIRS